MNKSKQLIVTSIIALTAFLTPTLLIPATVGAADGCAGKSPAQCIQEGGNQTTDTAKNPSLQSRLKTIVNVILFILGAIAVIVIVIGGLRYVLSAGDANAIKGAKDTILYAVVGLIVALLAYSIVNFVLTQFTPATPTATIPTTTT